MQFQDDIGLRQHIFDKSRSLGINPAKIAKEEYQLPIASKDFWWRVGDSGEPETFSAKVNLTGTIDNALSRFVANISQSVQFPESSAFLHGLGVVSAAMAENFYYCFYGDDDENTCCLYTVACQPPSTGKSSVDKYLTQPGLEAYKKKNEINEVERSKINTKIGRLKASLKKASDRETEEISLEILEEEKKLVEFPHYVWIINDPTPEGCVNILEKQGGFYNVISDETAAISIILGMVYGDRNKKANNNGVFLRAWDNGYLSVARSTKEGFSGRIRGAVAILAQDLSVDSILTAGKSGEGISERFLILKEPNLLGTRNHQRDMPIKKELQEDYAEMISNVVKTGYKVKLKFTDEAKQMILSVKQDQESCMADGGKFSTPMLRGVVGKNDKQIVKISCVLHVIEHWSRNGDRNVVIDTDVVFQAVSIFNQLLNAYVEAADNKGFTGSQTELNKIISVLTKLAQKNKFQTDIRKLRDTIRKHQEFLGVEKLTEKLKQNYLPALEDSSHIVFDPDTGDININPWLA